MEKVRQMENLHFTLGNGSQICAVLEEFGDRPLVREALGRRCRKNELIKDVAVRACSLWLPMRRTLSIVRVRTAFGLPR